MRTLFHTRLGTFWTDAPLLNKEAVAAQLLLNAIRERGPLSHNRKRGPLERWNRLSAEQQQQKLLDL